MYSPVLLPPSKFPASAVQLEYTPNAGTAALQIPVNFRPRSDRTADNIEIRTESSYGDTADPAIVGCTRPAVLHEAVGFWPPGMGRPERVLSWLVGPQAA